MGDEKEGRRMSLMDVDLLLGQLHFLPSVEAEKKNKNKKTPDVIKSQVCMQAIDRTCDCNRSYSPCVGAEAVKGQTGSKE